MKKLPLSIIAMLLCAFVHAQELPKIVPPSPNAAAFHVYGNTQVNNYTGSTNISIPLWEVRDGELSVPIYLKYTGGNGIKVEEIASWVGLGWTLNAGGAVSRTIRGLADEDQTKKGFFKMTEIPIPTSSPSNISIFNEIGAGTADGEADKFMYNYPGGSGSFFYNYDQSIHFKPKKEISVSHTIGVESESVSINTCATYDEVIKDFTIKDEYGNSFFFKDKERSNTVTFGQQYTDNRGFPSSWYLRKMENRLQTNAIDFEYDTFTYNLTRSKSSILIDGLEDDIYTQTAYIGKRLKKISFSEGSVEFIASTDYRKDLNNNKYLDQIIVRDVNDKIIKKIQFNYKYMTGNGLVPVASSLTNDGTNRLILTSIEECDAYNNCKSPTEFTYNTTHYLPSRFSKGQDHWGYYNGQNNSKLEPVHVVTWYNPWNSFGNEWVTTTHGSANREPNAAYAKAGVLTAIKYPTKGTTNFEYEGHTAVHNESNGATVPIGGLRIENILHYSSTNQLATKQVFDYTGDDGKSSGRVVSMPKYYGLTYDFNDSSNQGAWLPVSYKRYVKGLTPLATTQGSHIGYGKVTFSYLNQANGKQESYYTTADDYPNDYNGVKVGDGFEGSPVSSVQIFDGVKIYQYPPPEEDSKDFLRGVIKKEVSYKKNGDAFSKVYEKLYSYDALKYSVGDMASIEDQTLLATKTVRGLKVHSYGLNAGADYTYYDIFTGYNLPNKTITKQYNSSGTLTQTTTQTYSKSAFGIVNHYAPTSTETTGSDGVLRKTATTYVFNKGSKTTAEQDLATNNALYTVLQTDSYKNTTKLGSQYTKYGITNNLNLPASVQTSKGSSALEDRIIFHSYYANGNVKEVSKKEGTHIVYIWGYNNTKPIAKIENITFNSIATTHYNAVVAASNTDANSPSSSSEQSLRTALAALQASLPATASMSYFTYDLLIGTTSITDPRGKTVYYHYDDFNRLEFVKDHDGNILSKNEYNYKN